MNTIVYKGHNLHKGSRAAELLAAKKFDELDKHLAEVIRAAQKLQGDPYPVIAALRTTLASRGFTIPA